jgi:hypothetical protein
MRREDTSSSTEWSCVQNVMRTGHVVNVLLTRCSEILTALATVTGRKGKGGSCLQEHTKSWWEG